jgi:hypothetical protein
MTLDLRRMLLLACERHAVREPVARILLGKRDSSSMRGAFEEESMPSRNSSRLERCEPECVCPIRQPFCLHGAKQKDDRTGSLRMAIVGQNFDAPRGVRQLNPPIRDAGRVTFQLKLHLDPVCTPGNAQRRDGRAASCRHIGEKKCRLHRGPCLRVDGSVHLRPFRRCLPRADAMQQDNHEEYATQRGHNRHPGRSGKRKAKGP